MNDTVSPIARGAAAPTTSSAVELPGGIVNGSTVSPDGGVVTVTVISSSNPPVRVIASSKRMPIFGRAELRFLDGRPRLTPLTGQPMHLAGVQAAGAVQLIRGDLVELGGEKLEVL